MRAAYVAWRDAPLESRQTVLSVVPYVRQRDILLLTEGLGSLEAGFFDNGRAWRRYVAYAQG